jgi:glucose-1-phosphatase
MQIKAIILDIGGVLWLPPKTPLSEKWAVRCNVDAKTFDKIVYASELGKQALVGTITSEQMWTKIGNRLKFSVNDLRELEQDYWQGHWNVSLLDYLKILKPNYKLGIISDAESNARDMVRHWINEAMFDAMVFSAEEKVCKPNPRIFQSALQKLGVQANDALFIDDRAGNVEGAKQLGIHSILYENFFQLSEALNNYIPSSMIVTE